jgi:hypothetical protein
MTEPLPEFVLQYLHFNKKLQDLRETEKEIKLYIDKLQPDVGLWLQSKSKYEVSLEFQGDELTQLGSKGKLRFTIDKRKEYLSKNALFTYLCSFFSSVYADKEASHISELSHAAVNHIWLSRKTTKNVPVVTRTFSKKRKLTI